MARLIEHQDQRVGDHLIFGRCTKPTASSTVLSSAPVEQHLFDAVILRWDRAALEGVSSTRSSVGRTVARSGESRS